MKYLRAFEDYNKYGDHPYVQFNSNSDLDLSAKAFYEWYDADFSDSADILKILEGKPDSILMRYGLDTSGEDDTGIIDKIMSNNYDLLDSGNSEGNKSWKLVVVEDLIKVYIAKNEIANVWEDDDIYNGHYVSMNPDTAKQVEIERDLIYQLKQIESEKAGEERDIENKKEDEYNKIHYPFWTMEYREQIRLKLHEFDENLPFSISRYGDYPDYQTFDVFPNDYDDKTNYTQKFIDVLKAHNIDFKVEEHLKVSSKQFLELEPKWFI